MCLHVCVCVCVCVWMCGCVDGWMSRCGVFVCLCECIHLMWMHINKFSLHCRRSWKLKTLLLW